MCLLRFCIAAWGLNSLFLNWEPGAVTPHHLKECVCVRYDDVCMYTCMQTYIHICVHRYRVRYTIKNSETDRYKNRSNIQRAQTYICTCLFTYWCPSPLGGTGGEHASGLAAPPEAGGAGCRKQRGRATSAGAASETKVQTWGCS